MFKFCVFAGTAEGRELVEFLTLQDASVTACVATEYGETLLTPHQNLTVSAGRLLEEEMCALFRQQHFDLVVDATHPYARVVTENICNACQDTGTRYLRLLRETQDAPEDSVFVRDVAGAVSYLNTVEGNILLTTGSKELAGYTGIRNFSDRVYARVLPMAESLALCQQAALPPAHILAMQGPFSEEMNVAMLKSVKARFLITKESGTRGGFDQKVAAARKAGARLVVIGRPPQKEGLSFCQTLTFLRDTYGFSLCPEVTVAGIGPGNVGAMTAEVQSAIQEADCVIGASRMLESVVPGDKPRFDAIAPEAIAACIAENPQYRRFAVVMSGDTGFFSGTKKLLPLLTGCRTRVLPGLSSLSCLCARLGTSYEDVYTVSMHGRDRSILPDVRTHARVFTLVGGDNGLGRLCQSLTDSGLGDVSVSAGQRLGYEDEKITVGTAAELSHVQFPSLSVALIENPRFRRTVTHGLPDEAFQRAEGREGVVPMTKSEVRSVCLSKLRLEADSICWDVGAGTGSCAIEMALQAVGGQVYAIEKKEDALALLRDNCLKFGADNVTVVPGTAPAACGALPAPTHVFVGGSSGNMKAILQLALQKNPGVRVVATAIALESVGELTECMKTFAFREQEVCSLSVARSRKAGPYHLMTGLNPIHIFTMEGGTPL